jgi:hypothetical protein
MTSCREKLWIAMSDLWLDTELAASGGAGPRRDEA